ncbi:MAG: hypothetical protein ACRDF4_08170, partial [Rhabdochlamydiaceae bacterium]
ASGTVYYKGSFSQVEVPDDSEDLIIEEFVPYRLSVVNGRPSLIRTNFREMFLGKGDFVLVRNVGGIMLLYPKALGSLSRTVQSKLAKRYNKKLAVIDRYDEYSQYSYAVLLNKRFTALLRRVKGLKTAKEMEGFVGYCLAEDKRFLNKAEKILGKSGIALYDALLAKKYLSYSAVYMEFVASLLPNGYGIRNLKSRFNAISSKMGMGVGAFLQMAEEEGAGVTKKFKVDRKLMMELRELIKIYELLKKWDTEVHNFDPFEKRRRLSKTADSVFASKFKKTLDEPYSGMSLKELERRYTLTGRFRNEDL